MIKVLITNGETSKSSVCSLDLKQENIFQKIWPSWDIKCSLLSLALIICCKASQAFQPGILFKLGNNYSEIFPNLTSVFQHCQPISNLLGSFSLVCPASFHFASNLSMPTTSVYLSSCQSCCLVQLSSHYGYQLPCHFAPPSSVIDFRTIFYI